MRQSVGAFVLLGRGENGHSDRKTTCVAVSVFGSAGLFGHGLSQSQEG